MKTITLAFAGLALLCASAHAAETLDAEAVAKLITGNTVHGLTPDGHIQRDYFAPDGKTYRQERGKILAGTWRVNDDGTQCVDGVPGDCAQIIPRKDGTYDRIVFGGDRLKWITVVKGKDF